MRIYFVLITIFLVNFAYGDDIETVNIHDLVDEPLFVSLGSTCDVGHALRASNLRKAAFPFDWITSIDSEKFLEILAQDFLYFLDEKHLCVGDRGPGPLIHTYYHLEFLHEGDFRDKLYVPNMLKLRNKYKRRIDRFRSLASYKGKVFFVRSAYRHSLTDPHRYYFCKENIEISDDYAYKLYYLLKERFPKLDFTLILINNHSETGVKEEARLNENIIKIRLNPTLESSSGWTDFKQCLLKL